MTSGRGEAVVPSPQISKSLGNSAKTLRADPNSWITTLFGSAPGERFGGAAGLHLDGLIIGAQRAANGVEAEGAIATYRERTLSAGDRWDPDNVDGSSDGRYHSDSSDLPQQSLTYLGSALDVDESRVIAGMRGFDAPTSEGPAHFDDGAALVLTFGSNKWSVESEIVLTDPLTGELLDANLADDLEDRGIDLNTSGWQLGSDVTIHGDHLAISAPYAAVPEDALSTPQLEAGLVLSFIRDENGWTYDSMVTRNDVTGEAPALLDHFGHAITLQNDLLAVGAPNAEAAGAASDTNNGYVYVFRRDGAGGWQHVDTLHPTSPAQHYDCGRFGWSVDSEGSTIIVGQPGATGLDCPEVHPSYHRGQGRAWAYEPDPLDANDWSTETMLFVELPPPGSDWIIPAFGAQYGWSVAVSPCHAAIGAPGGDLNQTTPGIVYHWTHIGHGAWDFETVHEPLIGEPGDQWGRSVSVTERHLAIGGWLVDAAFDDAGAVDLWNLECDCNSNGIPDLDEIEADPDLDCDKNLAIDSCELARDASLDCDGDGLLDVCQITPPDALVWDVADGGNGHAFQAIAGDITAEDAAVAADALLAGAEMASLTSWSEASFLAIYHPWNISAATVWLGGVQDDPSATPDSDWTWRTGEPWDWTPWSDPTRPQPDDAGGDERAILAVDPALSGTWDWDDALLTSTGNGWMLELDLDCDGNGRLDVCDINDNLALDCDGDGRIDSCMIDDLVVPDCDGDGNPDACNILWGALDCNGNGRPDVCDLADGSSGDCNFNNIPDECDIADGTSADDNANGIPDECEVLLINELMVDPAVDLNGDGVIDTNDQFIEIVNYRDELIDISNWKVQRSGLNWYIIPDGTTLDAGCVLLIFTSIDDALLYVPAQTLSANQSGSPLAIPNPGETRTITLRDLADNVVDDATYGSDANGGASVTRCPDLLGLEFVQHDNPTECAFTDWDNLQSPGRRIDQNLFWGVCSADSDGDGVIDADDNCSVANPDQLDCDSNGIGDVCDILNWVAGGGDHSDLDCNWDWRLDGYDEDCNPIDLDCNDNGIIDTCDLNTGVLLDCDGNLVPDSCDIASGGVLDCNGNGVPDECDIAEGVSDDCNDNGIPDACDLADGNSGDLNDSGIPDECECDPACDLSGDFLCNIQDMLLIISDIPCPNPPGNPAPCEGDFNGDGLTDINDLLDFISAGCQS